ncbi:MAG: hypothetical protein AAFX44_00150 [Pseudomonadota bacterium]
MVAAESPHSVSSVPAVAAVTCAGVIAALAFAFLARESIGDGADLGEFLVVAGIVLALQIAIAGSFLQKGWQMPVMIVVGFAAVFRVIGVIGAPILEDDHFRFMWDGRSSVEIGSPYGHAPLDSFDAELGEFDDVLDGINHPDIPTVYGPSSQWTFALAYLIAPAETWPLQLLSALADLAIVMLLVRVASPMAVFLYAWSPLPIKEFAFTAHPDAIGALLLFVAFLAFKSRREWPVGIAVALALGVKPFALVLAPYLLGLSVRAWLAFVVTAIVIAAPFGFLDAWVPEGLAAMASVWLFNAPLYYLALFAGGPIAVQLLKGILLLAYSAWWASRFMPWIWAWLRRKVVGIETVPAAMSVGLFLAILPVLNPWYLVWWLPFAAIGPLRFTPWVVAAVVLASYVTGINLSSETLALYEQPTWVLVAEAALIIAALAFDIRSIRRR